MPSIFIISGMFRVEAAKEDLVLVLPKASASQDTFIGAVGVSGRRVRSGGYLTGAI